MESLTLEYVEHGIFKILDCFVVYQTAHLQSACPLTFAALVLGHHSLKDNSYHLSDSGSRCVVGDVVLGKVQTETKHNGLAQTDQTLIMIIIITLVVIIIVIMTESVLLYLGQNFIVHHSVGSQQHQNCLQQFQLLQSILHQLP